VRRLTSISRWLVIAVTAVTAAVVFVADRSSSDDSCGNDLVLKGTECIGITDGSVRDFNDDLDDVLKKVHEENKKVRGTKDRVKIAFMIPATTGETGPETLDSARTQIQGALAAVHRANTKLGPRTIRFELVLANTGDRSRYWEIVTEKIVADQRIVAVTGLGSSIDTTLSAITRLKRDKVPMVGATISADDLHDIQGGLVRVSPTNEDEAKALVQEVPKTAKGSVMLLVDADETDLYAADLAGEFKASLADLKLEEVPFTYGPAETSGDPFWQLRVRICSRKPSYILFAGRGRQLQDLLQGFGAEACDGLNTTIISGDDAGRVVPEGTVSGALRLGISLRYASLAAPDAITLRPALKTGFGQFEQSWQELGYGKEDMADGQAMMAYDSVYAVVQAANNVGSKGVPVTRTGIAGQWSQMNDLQDLKYGFNGASGRITFDPTTGNSIAKPIPIIELSSTGVRRLVAVR
jgi:ABC-type branched-subunit amino acid transport system substrate-binding protein